VTNYTGAGVNFPEEITAGPDGALWFATDGGSIGRITTAGVVSNYTGAGISVPRGVTGGPDGALWFTNGSINGGSIGRITTVPSVSVLPGSGATGTSVVVSGGGYSPGELVKATYKTGLARPNTSAVAICSTTANPNGTFSCTGSIPTATAGADGAHTIKAKGMTSHATAKTIFTLT
jgi:hypothetical protein